jgi:Ion channel
VNGHRVDVPGPPAADRPREASNVGGRERYGLLLAAIVVAFAVQGIASTSQVEQIIVSALLGATLLLSLWCAEAKPIVVRVAAMVVVAVFLASIVETVVGTPGGGATRLANALLVSLAPPAIVVGVVRTLRARQGVTLEAVFGVLCVYLLIGMLYAFLYGSIDRLGGGPFFAGGQPASVAECLYYSFTTLTTVGYGDLTARTNLGHTLSVSEALVGQIYLVTIVSLIVANLGRSRPATPQG